MGNSVRKIMAAIGASFLVASCATSKAPADEVKPDRSDPHAEYHNPNAPFSAPIAPTDTEKKSDDEDRAEVDDTFELG